MQSILRSVGVCQSRVQRRLPINGLLARQCPSGLIQTQQRPRSPSRTETTARLFSRYVAVDHSSAYEEALKGRHGQQLAITKVEGIGKDDEPFDPFIEEEMAEDNENSMDGASAADGEDMEEAETVGDDDDDEEDDALYNRDGSVIRNKSALAVLRAGYPAGGMFAAIELGGNQHKVTTDDVIVVNRLKPVEDYKIGSVHTIKDVMLVGSSHLTLVGLPHVKGAEVDIMVEEITQDKKVTIFKKRRRKNSQRKRGFRRDVTLARVLDIRMPDEYKDHKHVDRDIVDRIGEPEDIKQPILA